MRFLARCWRSAEVGDRGSHLGLDFAALAGDVLDDFLGGGAVRHRRVPVVTLVSVATLI